MLDLEAKSSNDPASSSLSYKRNSFYNLTCKKNKTAANWCAIVHDLPQWVVIKISYSAGEKSLSDHLYNISRERLVCVYLYSTGLVYRKFCWHKLCNLSPRLCCLLFIRHSPNSSPHDNKEARHGLNMTSLLKSEKIDVT